MIISVESKLYSICFCGSASNVSHVEYILYYKPCALVIGH